MHFVAADHITTGVIRYSFRNYVYEHDECRVCIEYQGNNQAALRTTYPFIRIVILLNMRAFYQESELPYYTNITIMISYNILYQVTV